MFQCTLPHEFRDVTCKNANLELNYIDGQINTASLGNPLVIFSGFLFLLKKRIFLFSEDMTFAFCPNNVMGMVYGYPPCQTGFKNTTMIRYFFRCGYHKTY